MPSQKQRLEKEKRKHPEKLPGTQIKNESIQRWGRAQTQITDKQLQKCCRKAQRVSWVGLENTKDGRAVQKTRDWKGKSPALLWKHSWLRWNFRRNEKSIPGADSWGVWGV